MKVGNKMSLFKKLRYNIVRASDDDRGWKFWECIDFNHLFEREGYLNYSVEEKNLDVLFLTLDVLTLKKVDNVLLNLLNTSTNVIFIHALQNAAGSFFIKIPEFWPKRQYIILHQTVDLSNCQIDKNVIPIFYDFVYDEYRSWWFRAPFKSDRYYGPAHEFNDKFYRIAKIHSHNRNKVAVCVARTRETSLARLYLQEIFNKNNNWLFYASFKSYDNKNADNNMYKAHLKGMRDDPINNVDYDPINEKLMYKGEVLPELTANNLVLNDEWAQSNLIHNKYYEDTYLSVYAESIENDTIYVTEKTYTPLLNGHFILPFGAKGFVKYLKGRGFLLPNFIDYSYDDIFDYQKRILSYGAELNRLMNINLDTWKKFYEDNINMIYYNRFKIWSDPYQKLGIL